MGATNTNKKEMPWTIPNASEFEIAPMSTQGANTGASMNSMAMNRSALAGRTHIAKKGIPEHVLKGDDVGNDDPSEMGSSIRQ